MAHYRNTLIFGCIAVAVLIGLPLFIKLGINVMNLMVMLFIYIILAQSWNIIAGFALQIHLGLAAFFGCGVFVTHILWERGVPITIATAVGALASVILSGIIGLPTLRLRGMYFAIGTLALAETLRITVGNVFPTTMYMPPSYAIHYSLLSRYYFALVVMVITCTGVAIIANSKLGLAVLALGEDEEEIKFVEEYVQKEKEVPWLVYTRQPDCVFFSHAAHVVMAQIDCKTCHGDVGESDHLKTYEANRITGVSRDIWGKNIAGWKNNTYDRMKMDDCADCHEKMDVPASSVQTKKDACFVCHK